MAILQHKSRKQFPLGFSISRFLIYLFALNGKLLVVVLFSQQQQQQNDQTVLIYSKENKVRTQIEMEKMFRFLRVEKTKWFCFS